MKPLEFKCPQCKQGWGLLQVTEGVTSIRFLLHAKEGGEIDWGPAKIQTPVGGQTRRTFECARCHSVLTGVWSASDLIEYLKEQNDETA